MSNVITKVWLLYFPFATVPLFVVGYEILGEGISLVIIGFFLFAPLVGTLVDRNRLAPPDLKASGAAPKVSWRTAALLWVPLECGLLLWSLRLADAKLAGAGAFAGLVLAVGLTVAAVGIPLAHELMHRSNRIERAMAEALMYMSSYPHFCITHVLGHHRKVGSAQDCATARRGESLYGFYPRAIIGGLTDAWQLEARRLRKRGFGPFCRHNRILRYLLIMVLTYAAVALVFGPSGIAFFTGQSLVGILMLEGLNYVQHYGLTREETAPGRHETIAANHAWNASYRRSNWLLFNLGRHFDHHVATDPYLRPSQRAAGSPELPAGYWTMFLMALVPPLWRRVMDPRVEAVRHRRLARYGATP